MENKILVVGGADTQIGLNIIRSLGKKGLKVFCTGSSELAIGFFSKYTFKKFIVPYDQDKEKHFLDKIIKIIKQNSINCVFAISENITTTLNKKRKEIEKYAKLMVPEQIKFELVLNKRTTISIAKKLNIPTPNTINIKNIHEIEKLDLNFPVVLKPSYHLYKNKSERNLDFKTKYVYSKEELKEIMYQHQKNKHFPLIQEYCRGSGIGIEILMKNGKVLAIFQHNRIREYPPTGGVSTLRESSKVNPKLKEYSVKLLKKIKWEGPAMVEFRYDKSTGNCALMEVNGRFWGSLPLAIKSGVDFPYLFYRSHFENSLNNPLNQTYKFGLKCRQFWADTKWLLDMLFKQQPSLPDFKISKPKAILEYLKSFNLSTKYDVESLDDPLPGIVDWYTSLTKPLKNLFKQT